MQSMEGFQTIPCGERVPVGTQGLKMREKAFLKAGMRELGPSGGAELPRQRTKEGLQAMGAPRRGPEVREG